jgi:hypothetical protein
VKLLAVRYVFEPDLEEVVQSEGLGLEVYEVMRLVLLLLLADFFQERLPIIHFVLVKHVLRLFIQKLPLLQANFSQVNQGIRVYF